MNAITGGLYDASVTSVNWSPDGQYVAIGGRNIGDGYEDAGYQLQIFRFDRTTNTVTPVAGDLYTDFSCYNLPDIPCDTAYIHVVSWSPDGQYIAVATKLSGTDYIDELLFRIYHFDRTTNGLTFVAGEVVNNYNPSGFTPDQIQINFVNWSSDSRYVVITLSNSPPIRIFEFNSGISSLSSIVENGVYRS